MRVLITVEEVDTYSGGPLYVFDVALELRRRGHDVVVFGYRIGRLGRRLGALGVPIVDRLDSIGVPPDLIHGNSFASTVVAVNHFPGVPTISVRHIHNGVSERTPRHPSVVRHFGVSRICVERIVADGVPRKNVDLLLNFVDTSRYAARGRLPTAPHKALVFSNYVSDANVAPALRQACADAQLDLTFIGRVTRNMIEAPEFTLPYYDVVFAKAKSAIEAMAVGCAVVLCDFAGLGPMVSTSNFSDLRPLNFGFEALNRVASPAAIVGELRKYDPRDAELVGAMIREQASLGRAVDRLLEIYESVLSQPSVRVGPIAENPLGRRIARRIYLAIVRTQVRSPLGRLLKGIPGLPSVFRALKAGIGRRAFD